MIQMRNDAAHKESGQIFEAVFGIPLLVAIAMHFIVPFSLPRGRQTLVFVSVGITLMILGALLATMARGELRRNGQPIDPGYPTRKIVTSGVFSISRNPLYLGGIAILAGLALAINFPWLMVHLIPGIVACHYILIMPEERYLADTFGEEYRKYTEKVGRWIGRKR